MNMEGDNFSEELLAALHERLEQRDAKMMENAAATSSSTKKKNKEKKKRSYQRKTSNYAYICPHEDCIKIFNKASQLNAHIKRHDQQKKLFICNWKNCGKQFCRLDALERHKRTHSGIKPYICHICNTRYTRSDYLARHCKKSKVHRLRLNMELGIE